MVAIFVSRDSKIQQGSYVALKQGGYRLTEQALKPSLQMQRQQKSPSVRKTGDFKRVGKHFPDGGLHNEVREALEEIIDTLHEPHVETSLKI